MASDMVRVPRPSNNQFSQEPRASIGRSQFNRSHGLKTTFNASLLIPIYVDEVLPGDTFTCRLNGFCRIFSPLDAPIMDNIEMETFFFFVPTRLLWDNWENFNGAHDAAGAQDTNYTIPICNTPTQINHDGADNEGRLFMAYMGLPEGLDTQDVDVNCLPFRAYHFIYNEWFRDQNLIDEVAWPTDNGPDDATEIGVLHKSAKKHDYFTSCLPYLQKGSAVTVGLTGITAVEMNAGAVGDVPTIWAATAATFQKLDSDGAQVDVSASGGFSSEQLQVNLGGALNTTAGLDINALRQSVAIQRLLEKDARGGTRYVEIIKSHFGVTSPDFRLQRPEYLGGGKSFINVSPVANTSDTATAKQAELSGVGTGVIQGHSWAKSFVEHGYILGLIRARGDLTYFQGLERMWTRSTRYDFYIPSLANLGEQSVLNKELFISNLAATDDAVFGYQERWAEYRFKKSNITATFNPDIAGSLSHWHLAEDFSSLPSLNATFIEDQTPMVRVETITTEHDFLLDLWFDLKCARPMPVHSIPSLVGVHF